MIQNLKEHKLDAVKQGTSLGRRRSIVPDYRKTKKYSARLQEDEEV